MRSLSNLLIVLSWSAIAGAQMAAPAPLIDAVQVVTYIDLEPAEACSAFCRSSAKLSQEIRVCIYTDVRVTLSRTPPGGPHDRST